jgi:hypothetical protein
MSGGGSPSYRASRSPSRASSPSMCWRGSPTSEPDASGRSRLFARTELAGVDRAIQPLASPLRAVQLRPPRLGAPLRCRTTDELSSIRSAPAPGGQPGRPQAIAVGRWTRSKGPVGGGSTPSPAGFNQGGCMRFRSTRPASKHGVPPCPQCNQLDRVYCHFEGRRKIAVCFRCFRVGEIRKTEVNACESIAATGRSGTRDSFFVRQTLAQIARHCPLASRHEGQPTSPRASRRTNL